MKIEVKNDFACEVFDSFLTKDFFIKEDNEITNLIFKCLRQMDQEERLNLLVEDATIRRHNPGLILKILFRKINQENCEKKFEAVLGYIHELANQQKEKLPLAMFKLMSFLDRVANSEYGSDKERFAHSTKVRNEALFIIESLNNDERIAPGEKSFLAQPILHFSTQEGFQGLNKKVILNGGFFDKQISLRSLWDPQ